MYRNTANMAGNHPHDPIDLTVDPTPRLREIGFYEQRLMKADPKFYKEHERFYKFGERNSFPRRNTEPIVPEYQRPPAVTPELFMTLPPELRTMIYDYAEVLPKGPIKIHPNEKTVAPFHKKLPGEASWMQPSILTVSRAIRSEAASFWYSTNAVSITVKVDELWGACHFLRGIAQVCGERPFRCFQILVSKAHWGDLHHLDSLVWLYHTVPIELHTASHPFRPSTDRERSTPQAVPRPTADRTPELAHAEYFSIFRMVNPTQVKFQDALEAAVQLGRTARQEHWTPEQRDAEFQGWMAQLQSSKHVRTLERLRVVSARKTAAKRAAQQIARAQLHARLH